MSSQQYGIVRGLQSMLEQSRLNRRHSRQKGGMQHRHKHSQGKHFGKLMPAAASTAISSGEMEGVTLVMF